MDAFDAVRVLLPLNITVFCLDFAGSGLSEGCVLDKGVCACVPWLRSRHTVVNTLTLCTLCW